MTSTSTAAETQPAEVAEKAPAKRTRKPVAAKAQSTVDVVDHETGETSDEVRKTFVATATGRGGRENNRKFGLEMHFAVDVADDQGHTPAAKAGLIFRFFATEAKAQAFAEKMNTAGYDAVVVAATSVEA